MSQEKNITEPKSVTDLLAMPLAIPDYQRPYKWTIKNMADLLSDIENAIAQQADFNRQAQGSGFRYRIGTIILHYNAKACTYDVVDGQQRILSLLLIRKCLDPQNHNFIQVDLSNKITQTNLRNNYLFVRDWFALGKEKAPVLEAFSKLLEVIVITVDDTAKAFQLFDSQNARGKELDPHDLLKAYHLREMADNPFEMQRAVTKWESVKPEKIKELFGNYLFCIIKWADRYKCGAFTANEIDRFKGITLSSAYTYADRAGKAMPTYQIPDAFLAGNNFFSYVDHYYALLQYLRSELERDSQFTELKEILKDSKLNHSVGFVYAKTLFECALLSYYDRFRRLDVPAVKKLFTWAFMLRVDMERLGFDTVNNYAAGNSNSRYSNVYPMFYLIYHARLHTEISNLPLQLVGSPAAEKNTRWARLLYPRLKQINGISEAHHE